jgi:UDP-galactopyranose mutase
MIWDYVVVGSGLTGATIARALTDAGKRVLVLERRAHVGGNAHDDLHPSGIRVHTYGPHYFRTNSERIWKFVNRFAAFEPYVAQLKSFVDGGYENWPIAASYIRRVAGEAWKPEFRGVPENFEQACLAMMPRVVYEKFVKGYTEKQWGVPAATLSAALAKRFDVRQDDDPRLLKHRYQALPRDGYAALMQNLLAGIAVECKTDYFQVRDVVRVNCKTIFTGPIDEFFGFELGRLKYRGQVREHTYLPDVKHAQPVGQVNNPDPANGAHIRTLEWKHMMPRGASGQLRGTVLTRETTVTPIAADHYEYPFPDDANAQLYARYRRRAQALPEVLICGRLGEYRYYDMDQAIGRALMLAQQLLESSRVSF